MAIFTVLLLTFGLVLGVRLLGMFAAATHPAPASAPLPASTASAPPVATASAPESEPELAVEPAVAALLREAARVFLGAPVRLLSAVELDPSDLAPATPESRTAFGHWSREGRSEVIHSHRLR